MPKFSSFYAILFHIILYILCWIAFLGTIALCITNVSGFLDLSFHTITPACMKSFCVSCYLVDCELVNDLQTYHHKINLMVENSTELWKESFRR